MQTINHITTCFKLTQCGFSIKQASQLLSPDKNVNNHLKILHLNAQSVRNKKASLEILAYEENIDIFCISEHWLKHNETQYFCINGYSIVSSFSRAKGYGGVCILVKDVLLDNITNNPDVMQFNLEKTFECCAVKYNINTPYHKETINIVTIYRSPTGNINCHSKNECTYDSAGNCCFFDRFNNLLNKLNSHKNTTILVGDLNLNSLNMQDNNTIELQNLLKSFNLTNTIKEATRINLNTFSETSIDYVITNITDEDCITNVIKTEVSDHYAQTIIVNRAPLPCNKITIHKRIFNETTRNKFINGINNTNWATLILNNSGEQMFVNFYDHFMGIFHQCFQLKKVSIKIGKDIVTKKWYPKKLKPLKSKIREAYKTKNKTELTHLRKIYRKRTNLARRSYTEKTVQFSKNKSKAMWGIVNDELGKKKFNLIPPKVNVKSENGDLITNPQKVVDELNSYFINSVDAIVQEKRNNCNFDFKINGDKNFSSLVLYPCDANEVKKIIEALPKNSSPGNDEITSEILISVADAIAPPLAFIISNLMMEGVFPNCLKVSKIRPIPKVKNTVSLDQYRPIALLSVFSKLIEKIIYIRLIKYCNSQNIITNSQHGFRAHRSTSSAILELLDEIYLQQSLNNLVLGIFIDLKKAFDVVNHELLLKKLEFIGIRGNCLEFFKSYLTGRSQFVSLSQLNEIWERINYKTDLKNCSHGVPQGSVLGPLLFILFINDIEAALQNYCKIVLYADDIALIIKGKNIRQLIINKNKVMSLLENYFDINSLIMNHQKTKYLLFNKSQNTERLFEKESGLVLSSDCKYLGVHIDNKLCWDKHIDVFCKRLSSLNFAFKIVRKSANLETLKTMYYGHVNSLLSYAILAWGSSVHGPKIFRCQKKIIRTMVHAKPRQSCKEIFKKLGILTFPSMCINALLLYTKMNLNKFKTNESVSGYNTRRSKDLFKQFGKSNLAKRSHNHLGPELFNKLPAEIKSAADCDLKDFQKLIYSYLLKSVFYDIQIN